MQHQVTEEKTGHNWANLGNRPFSRFNALLLVFLLVSLLLIFAIATLGMQRSAQQWLPVNLMPRISGNYSVDASEANKLARVNPQIIEAVRRDAQVAKTSLANAGVTPKPAVAPTLIPSLPRPELTVNAGGPYRGFEGSLISLVARGDGSALNSVPGSAITYRWDLDHDNAYDEARGGATSIIFFDEGEYTIGLQATDRTGRVATDTTTVSVSNVAPIVNIDETMFANEAEEILFLASARDPGHDVLLYEWDFGDGSVRVLYTLSPKHAYLDNGDYTVRLRVRDNDDGLTEASMMVHVMNLPPLVDAGPDRVTNEGDLVVFNGNATDPAGDLDKLTYAWDLNYDGSTFTFDVLGPNASIVYADGPATMVAALLVQDDDDGQTIDTVHVTVGNVAPKINSVTNNGPVGEGAPVTVQINATDVGSDTLTYAFDWNNDGSFEAENQPATASHTWYNQSNYTVGLRASDEDGGQVFTTTTVSVFNVPPTAVASGPSGARFEGSAVDFNGSGSSDPGTSDVLTYTWSFGDGSIASGINVTHIYADNNVYSTTLTVMDDSGDSDTDSIPVTILNANPVAEAGPDRTIDEGALITFNGNASDPGTADTLTLAWDFNYNGATFDVEATGSSVQTTYFDGPATYEVALRVQDDDYPYPTGGGGGIGEHIDTLIVTVQNVPPIADAQGPYVGIETFPITLSGTATDIPPDAPLTYQWNVGSTYILTGQTVITTWNTAGVYTITLRVTDKDGGIGSDTTQVTINNAPPTAEANGPYTTTVNLPVTLSGAGSTDPTGDPLTYQWNFGDGTPVVITTNITVTHIYADDGIFTAILRVNDGRGGIGTDTTTVTVNNLPPTAVASASLTTTLEGAPITFDGSGSSDPGLYDTLTHQWDFGDGSPIVNGITATHAYGDDNVYTVILTVTDDGGAVDTDAITITILNANPTAVASANPNPALEGNAITFDGSGSSDPGFADTLTYEWDFGDGSPFVTGIIVTHTYTDNNVYTATLTVTDDDSLTDTDTILTILNANPIAVASANPNPVLEGNPVTLDGSSSGDPGTNDTFTYEWDFDYDGFTFDVQGTGQSVVTSYLNGPTVYTIALRVRDDDYPYPTGGGGEIGENITTVQLIVDNAPPTADAGGPYTTTVGIPVTLTGSGSDVSADPLTYAWDLDNDGAFETPGQVVTYTNVTTTGIYTVGLQVDDGDGGLTTDPTTVQVSLIIFAWPGILYFLIRGRKVIKII